MAEDLQALLIKQTTVIASIRRVLPNFKKIGRANITSHKTKKRLDDLETLWESYQRLNIRLLQLTPTEKLRLDKYFTEEEFFAAEDAYHEADYLADVIGNFATPKQSGAASVSDVFIRDSSSSVSLQLPRISLPKFSGSFSEWENFRGLFESLVASKESLSNTQKLHYLKTSVTGEAAVLISHIQIADTNYDAAWKLLVEEYENQSAIIHSHIHAFANLPLMKIETATELKTLRDTVAASLNALSNLSRPVDKWDDLLVYIISQKFSPRTRNEWNLRRGGSTVPPTYNEIREFMTLRIRGLTDYSRSKPEVPSSKNKLSHRASINNVAADKCLSCSGNHCLMQCDDFQGLSVEQKTQLLRAHKCCFNCLKTGHFPVNCPSKKQCNVCRRAHHTLLHRDTGTQVKTGSERSVSPDKEINLQSNRSITSENKSETAAVSVQMITSPAEKPPNVLLATAWVILRTEEDRKFKVRALLDQGSAFSFISESLCQAMRTKRSRASLQVHCFGERYSGVARSRVSLTLETDGGQGSSFSLTAFVYQKITSYAGSRTKQIDSWPHLKNLKLADPDPFSSHPIHLLIGADLYGSLSKIEVRQGSVDTPTAQLTALGWILSGPTGTVNTISGSISTLNCVTDSPIDSMLQRFWEIEEIPTTPLLSVEDEECEKHFLKTHSRAADGRYIVRLPFQNGPPIEIGSSRGNAAILYAKLEHRLQRNSSLAKQYTEFLSEYETLDHMKSVPDDMPTRFPPVYVPHHPVLREASSTTKLRVVFNASCRTSNGTTLNDHLMTGPKLQGDLSSILLRWRQFQYVYTADIEKMFRQIRVHPDDVDFCRILWRPQQDRPIQSYRLLMVTYGTAPAPYLAMRVLKQLAHDEGPSFPRAHEILQQFLYVDDVLFGADEIQSLRETREQLKSLMSRGGFLLRKWAANAKELLRNIPPGTHELALEHSFDKDDSLKILGLTWIPREDSFRFQIAPLNVNI